METGVVRQFVKVTDGRIGAIIANDSCGGVFRGHCDVWFGEIGEDDQPVVEQLCVDNRWQVIKAPLGRTSQDKE